MAVVAATIKEVHLVDGNQNQLNPARKGYRLVLSLGTQTAGDTFAVVTANSKMAEKIRSGKTITLREASGSVGGFTPGGTSAYAFGVTVSGTTLSGSIGSSTGVAAAVASGTTASVYVTVDES
jgi:hypothetical protein